MLVSSSFARQPLLAVVLVIGLLVGFGALIWRLQDVLFGDAESGPRRRGRPRYVPLFFTSILVLIAGLWLPEPVRPLVRDGGGAAGVTR